MTSGIIIGVLITLCVALAAIVLIYRAQNRKNVEIIGGMAVRFNEIKDLIKNTPRNVINLSLKGVGVDTKLLPVELPIKPENFVINANKLTEILIGRLKTEKHPDIETRAYCILAHCGLSDILENKSWHESKRALIPLLINGDEEATKTYLKTLAESICAEMMNPHTEEK